MAETYQIDRIADLLCVPQDRRLRCVKELLIGLAFSELAGLPPGPMTWTDDGDSSCTIRDQNGGDFLKLEVKHG